MSTLSQFMHTARAVLDEQDREANPEQPPFEKRTPWLFECLEELALPGEVELFVEMKVARIRGDLSAIGRLVDQVHAAEGVDGATRHQRQQLCGWIKDQIRREGR